ncbi:glutamate synthase (NADPH/NADH) small chain [Hymenobacter luteus]|uniref:Glutamate synthase (NADPH/NADH) small chain n=2 Tax=Hymenobacter TaxID=89966 RepID=A0A7W9T3F5_9BACT|nr:MULTISPECIES: glutamate synthase subunit beta [Hymenobacter]MBB4601539.1 glutamate synthase (NADPH/NADH) small chain [Hymenobacter latericoloratus]MBB6060033.1 glutamate synthase (NADPH/NADH) small chain [Hymenobacter luteus]
MGNSIGFKEFEREAPAKAHPQERIGHNREFVGRYDEGQLHRQSGRCMECGIPFCHAGCPLGNIIPEFNDAVYRQDWAQAYQILSSTNNFPEFTGRICPAPCESACVLGLHAAPVAIEEIEKHIIEIAFEKGYVQPTAPLLKTGKTVAVVGSGPAGLAAAAQLVRAGHTVTVFERDDQPGGLLRYGIPDFKLDKWVLDRRLRLLQEDGVVFRCHTEVGRDIAAEELTRTFDAVVLAGGALVPRDLPIPGRELAGVHFAMDYLTQHNRRVSSLPIETPELLATGREVVVIGSGDTGSDCVGTANRQQARTITQLALMHQPSPERPGFEPWPHYPATLFRTSTSHEEGCHRYWGVNTKAFLGDEHGHLRALLVTDVTWETDVLGRRLGFQEIEGSEREIPCQLALLALGFTSPRYEGLLQQLGVALDERGNVQAATTDYLTSRPGVFVAGDMRRGQSLVVWAIAEGREAARQVDVFLMGKTALPSKDAVGMFG